MQINLQGKNMEVTSEIHDYVIEKITTLGKFLKGVEKKIINLPIPIKRMRLYWKLVCGNNR